MRGNCHVCYLEIPTTYQLTMSTNLLRNYLILSVCLVQSALTEPGSGNRQGGANDEFNLLTGAGVKNSTQQNYSGQ